MNQPSEHVAYICPGTNGDCVRGSCAFCDRGLFACINCFGLDKGGSLTTHCCGRALTAEETNQVQDSLLDYRLVDMFHAEWVKERSPHALEKI
jgi:hypothetical protein